MLKIAIIRNNITYLEFRNQLIVFQIFTLADIRKAFPDFDSKRLVEWQDKGYLIKLVNKCYAFADIKMTETKAFRVSNVLYHPSYISLESALSHYHLIPEGVYSHQAISTRKTMTYTTELGTFNYRTVKPDLFFGYTILREDELPVLLAEPEKALLDYLYLNANIKAKDDIKAIRLNLYELRSIIDWEKLNSYLSVFNSRTLDKRLRMVKKMMIDAHTS